MYWTQFSSIVFHSLLSETILHHFVLSFLCYNPLTSEQPFHTYLCFFQSPQKSPICSSIIFQSGYGSFQAFRKLSISKLHPIYYLCLILLVFLLLLFLQFLSIHQLEVILLDLLPLISAWGFFTSLCFCPFFHITQPSSKWSSYIHFHRSRIPLTNPLCPSTVYRLATFLNSVLLILILPQLV